MDRKKFTGYTTQRYASLSKVAVGVLRQAITDREKEQVSDTSTHTTRLSSLFSVDEIRRILETNELRATDAWGKRYASFQGLKDSDVSFSDFPRLNQLLANALDRKDAAAQILVLNDSLRGFVRVLAFFADNQELFRVLVSETSQSGRGGLNVHRLIEGVLKDNVDGVMREDLPDAAAFVYGVSLHGIECDAGPGGGQTMPKPKLQRIALVSCVKQKRTAPAAARDLYVSALFRGLRRYAEARADAWYILSAKHGLVRPTDLIEPYEQTLNTMGKAARSAWAEKVRQQLTEVIAPSAEIILLAGARYREGLERYFRERGHAVSVPLQGLKLGEQLRRLRELGDEPPRS